MAELRVVHEDGVDLDRGAIMRKDPSNNGCWICMYVDEPGIYFNDAGYEVSARRAKEAGFNIQEQVIQGLYEKRLSEIHSKLDLAREKGGEGFLKKLEHMSIEQLITFAEGESQRDDEEKLKDDERHNDAMKSPFSPHPDESLHITKRNAQARPRGTKYHTMKHIGAGWWDVLAEPDGTVALKQVKTDDAVEWMVKQAESIEEELQAGSAQEAVVMTESVDATEAHVEAV